MTQLKDDFKRMENEVRKSLDFCHIEIAEIKLSMANNTTKMEDCIEVVGELKKDNVFERTIHKL